MQDRTPLSQLIKKPSVDTKSASTGTERPSSPVNNKRNDIKKNKPSPPQVVQSKQNSFETGNKFQSIAPDVHEDMEASSTPSRLSRSRSRSRRSSGKISPVKYKK